MNGRKNRKSTVGLILMIAVILVSQASIVSCKDKGTETYPIYTGDEWKPSWDIDESNNDGDISFDVDETIEQISVDIPEDTKYIEIDDEEDVYSLERILALKVTKTNFFGSEYDINSDIDHFDLPEDIVDTEAKIAYLTSASYKLVNDITLTVQTGNNESFFVGIGSKDHPFEGIFNGNGKTVTLKSDGKIPLDNNTNHHIGLFGDAKNAKILGTNVKIETDILISKCIDIVKFGALAGSMSNCLVSDCNVTVSNAKVGVDFGKDEKDVDQAYIGGLVGDCTYSVIQNCNVTLTDGTLYANGYVVDTEAWCANFSVGGMLGFSGEGSDNKSDFGKIGNKLLNCKVKAVGSQQKDIIYASIESGDEVDAGGLVGCTFNNFVAKKCFVEITNGNIVAEKRGSTDDARGGTNVGGIIGRLEHTGELYRCDVLGNNLNIISRSPENYSSAGGIVGWDMGPYHRDVISINACSFDGGGTSKIISDISADDTKDIWNITGGIVGYGAYQIKDCAVENVTLENRSEKVTKCYVGGICGIFNNKSGFWTNNEFFTPGTPEIINCKSSKLTFNTTSNVKTNEVYPATK